MLRPAGSSWVLWIGPELTGLPAGTRAFGPIREFARPLSGEPSHNDRDLHRLHVLVSCGDSGSVMHAIEGVVWINVLVSLPTPVVDEPSVDESLEHLSAIDLRRFELKQVPIENDEISEFAF